MKKIAIYAGTFDPITNGHIDIIERAAVLFDEIIVAVATSDRKKPFFEAKKRVQFCQESVAHVHNAHVFLLEGLLVDFAKQHHATLIVRGIRTSDDVNYELSLANMNRQLSDARNQQCETIFMSATACFASISATIVREIIALKGDVSLFVPQCVVDDLK